MVWRMAWLNTLSIRPISTCSPFIIAITCQKHSISSVSRLLADQKTCIVMRAKTDLHESKLLLACIVVSGGSLILLSIVRALFVGVLVGWMNQLPGVLLVKSQSLKKNVLRQKNLQQTFICQKWMHNPVKSLPVTYVSGWASAAICTITEFTQEIKSYQLHLCMKCMLPHHFHDMSAPLGEQLHALQGQVEQLPVLSISLLGLLTPWSSHHLHTHRNTMSHTLNQTICNRRYNF